MPLHTALPIRESRPSPALQEGFTSLWKSPIHQQGGIRHKKITVPQSAIQSSHSRTGPSLRLAWSLALLTSRPTQALEQHRPHTQWDPVPHQLSGISSVIPGPCTQAPRLDSASKWSSIKFRTWLHPATVGQQPQNLLVLIALTLPTSEPALRCKLT